MDKFESVSDDKQIKREKQFAHTVAEGAKQRKVAKIK